jgi:hypothetical protein
VVTTSIQSRPRRRATPTQHNVIEAICDVEWHDGRETFKVRIAVAARHLDLAQDKSRPRKPSQDHICIQIREAIRLKYGWKPGRISWDHRTLKITEVFRTTDPTAPRPPRRPAQRGVTVADLEAELNRNARMADLADERAFRNRPKPTADELCGCVP